MGNYHINPALYTCSCCGFISTMRIGYIKLKGVLFCIDCVEEYQNNGDEKTIAHMDKLIQEHMRKHEELIASIEKNEVQ